MKIIYKNVVYTVKEMLGEALLVYRPPGRKTFVVHYSDPELIVEPTDSQLMDLEHPKAKRLSDPAEAWWFKSSSSERLYETVLWTDGKLSCDCPGWTKRATRDCKHVRAVRAGLADRTCMRHLAASAALSKAVTSTTNQPRPKTTKATVHFLDARRNFDL